ncbi:MAG: PKD domain-containing protein, partial [Bacteroidota bacterium]
MKCFRILVFLLFGLSSNVLLAQPVNDDCDNATNLPNVANWCSTQAQFNNAGATPSGFQAPVCWGQSRDDVWFSFNSIATDVTITVIGATPNGAGGTLRNPQVVLYQANDCGSTLNEQECATDAQGANVIELYKGGLVVGQNYLIRIQGSNNGSFQLCVNNYNPPVNPGSDCVSASVLCDTSPFTVQSVVGAGNDPDEAGTSSCLGGFGGNSETNSTWFVWTADAEEPGVLEFTLSPTNPSDDLDFVLFELTDGIGNCNAKTELRCMATGIDPSLFPSRCAGPTGLRAGETDNAEPPGCNNPSQNSFLAPLEMEAGKSYGLLINNFTATGNGFSIEFGGTGKFQGPVADFTSDATGSVCYGQDVNFTDASTFPLGELTNWQWSFGVDAVPATATGQNPPVVQWTSPGLKSVVLTVETDLGCIVTEIETILVEPCCEDVNAMTITPNITDALCP